jgi:hypothetical protein
MPDLSLPDFSDTTGRLLTEFNTFAQQVGDALPIVEQMGNEATTFKVLAMGPIISASTSPTE